MFQVVFNEALNKITSEKDKVIEELRAENTSLSDEIHKHKGIHTLNQLVLEKHFSHTCNKITL